MYGFPSSVEDGWVANLPAAEILAGEYNIVLLEVSIEAEDVHQRVGSHKEFYELHAK